MNKAFLQRMMNGGPAFGSLASPDPFTTMRYKNQTAEEALQVRGHDKTAALRGGSAIPDKPHRMMALASPNNPSHVQSGLLGSYMSAPRPAKNKRQIQITGQIGKGRNDAAWEQFKAANQANKRSPQAIRDSIDLLEADADMNRLGTTWWSRKFPNIAGGV